MTDEAPAPENLCIECGLCCNGALFDYGPLADDEVEEMREAGLTILEDNKKFGFGLPCPQIDGAVCQVYDKRPQTCRAFRCEVLKSVEAGDLAYEEGLQHVEQGRAALAQVHAQLPERATITDARRWRREASQADASEALNASPMLMMALGMLDLILDQHFRKPGQRQVMPVDQD